MRTSSLVGAAIAMKKGKSMLKHLGAASLFAATAWPNGAYAANEPAPAPAPANEQVMAPPRTVPEQFSTIFKIADDDNPEESVPGPKDRIRNPLEFGYYLQDLLTRAEVETKRHDYPRVIKYYRA